MGTGSLILVGIVLTCVLCYYGSRGTIGLCQIICACLKRFEVELHKPDCACISVHKKRYCPKQEAEKAGEYVHDRKDRADVELNSMASDSEEELSSPTYRATVSRSPRAPRSRTCLSKLKKKVCTYSYFRFVGGHHFLCYVEQHTLLNKPRYLKNFLLEKIKIYILSLLVCNFLNKFYSPLILTGTNVRL